MKSGATLTRALERYERDLADYADRHVSHEGAVRTAFQNLLSDVAPDGWKLIHEERLPNGVEPDGTMHDDYNLRRGYWEAKDTHDDLETEIRKKFAKGYPTNNIIFEDTRRAVLYQNGGRAFEIDLRDRRQLADLLRAFFDYREPHIIGFHQAVAEFGERIPELAEGLKQRIVAEHQARNRAFDDAWASFYALCKTTLDPNMRAETVDEMLVQHLLTERLFRTVFDNPHFLDNNVIAVEIEKVIAALTSRVFNRNEFLRSLDHFYVAIEQEARGLTDWSEKQAFMNTVYERFFQNWSKRQADTHGIVYTPQEIVDFMCASVEEVLQRDFGMSLSTPGVSVLDPATGTGSFIVNILRRIQGGTLKQKYEQDLFANEIMLLPYYIASLNIEHAYYERTREYLAFPGICFADTLELADPLAHKGVSQQAMWVNERNTERVQHEQDAKIMVVIGNPPYNVGQVNENDNNKNRRYDVIDARIRETYVKDSKATNRNALSDPYVKFFRWATDRLGDRDGIVCMVSNNSFVDQIAFDGMRQHLLKDFTAIYHIDLHGNVRQNPKLSGTTHNVFGIQVGVGITIAIRSANSPVRGLNYVRVPEDWRKEEKLAYLKTHGSISGVEWQQLEPDERKTWLTEGLHREFDNFLPIGTQEAKESQSGADTIFTIYSRGAETTRDNWVYDFDTARLATKTANMIETYNAELSRWIRAGCPKDIDNFVSTDETKIKWSSRLKERFASKVEAKFDFSNIRSALYRPFTREYLYFDGILVHRQGRLPIIFPTPATEAENQVIVVGGYGRKEFAVLVSNYIPDLNFYADPAQCFPYYVYNEDGSGRRENITDWALGQFQAAYGSDGSEVTKRDIFHYVYGVLHHPFYRERYAANLKRELPRIPLVEGAEAFREVARIGGELARLHLNYEQAREYPLVKREAPGEPVNWRVGEKRMRLSADKTALVYNDWLTLEGIPAEAFRYRLGNRSALEWVIDQYHVSTDSRSGITSDPNRPDDPQYIVRLIGQVVAVSVETVRLVDALARVRLVADDAIAGG